MWNFFGIFSQKIQVISKPSQQEGVCNNSSINPFVNNFQINSICIDDSIEPKIELNNVLTALNVGEIKDLDLTKQLGFDEFWNNSGAL
jgi:hypothetical protein